MNRIRSALVLAAALAAAPSSVAAQQDPWVLDGLLVTASPTPRAAGDVARFVTVLDGEEVRARGISLLSEALRDVPGLSVVRGGSFGAVTSVFLRGGESDYVQVLVDGVQVNQPGGAFDFASLTLENVERIEVVRGPASSLYGSDAVSGVIHVITRAGRGAPRGSAGLRAGTFGRRELSLGLAGGDGSAGWSLGFTRLAMDGLLAVNNGWENRVVSGTVRLAPDEVTRAALSLRLSDRTYHFPTDGSGAIVDGNAFTFGDELSASLSASRRVAPDLEVRGSVAVARTASGTDDRPDGVADTLGYYGFNSLDRVQRATADLRANLYRGPVVWTAGLELEEQEQRSFSESLSQWGPSVGRSEYDRWNRAAYAHLTGTVGAAAFAAGGRLEDNDRFGRLATWNAEMAWSVAAGLRVRAAAGVSIKEPTFYENHAEGWVRGNPDLLPERGRTVEVGLDGEAWGGRLRYGASAFNQRFADLIEYVAQPAGPLDPNFQNVAAARTRGIEVGGELRFGALRAALDWTRTATRVLDSGAGDAADADFSVGRRLLRRPGSTLNLRGSAEVGAGTLSADVRVVGDREDRDYTTWPARRVVLERYAVVGVGGELPLAAGITLGVRADNLLDARYEEVIGFAAPGRSLAVGVRVSFGGVS